MQKLCWWETRDITPKELPQLHTTSRQTKEKVNRGFLTVDWCLLHHSPLVLRCRTPEPARTFPSGGVPHQSAQTVISKKRDVRVVAIVRSYDQSINPPLLTHTSAINHKSQHFPTALTHTIKAHRHWHSKCMAFEMHKMTHLPSLHPSSTLRKTRLPLAASSMEAQCGVPVHASLRATSTALLWFGKAGKLGRRRMRRSYSCWATSVKTSSRDIV